VGDIFRPKIQIGALVRIPYGNKEDEGIVSAILEDVPPDMAERSIRPITDVVTAGPILAPYQMIMIERIAQKYLLPIHRVAGFVLTRNILERLRKKDFPLMPTRITSTEVDHGIFLAQDHIITAEDVLTHIGDDASWVIIVPDDIMLTQWQATWSTPETLFVFGEATDTRRAQAWIDIQNKKYPRIV